MLKASDIVQQVESTGLVAIIRAQSSEELVQVVGALRRGGLRCIEVTMTTPNALDVIRTARREIGDEAAIGVGTVLDPETARSAILAGAQFVVAPIVDLATIEMCRRYSVPVVPGAFTPTEIVRAWQAGADFVKVFPTGSVGPQYIRDLRGPLPQIKMIPTGGVQLDNLAEFVKAGAAALAAGSALVRSEWIKTKNLGAIESAATEWLHAIQKARAAHQ